MSLTADSSALEQALPGYDIGVEVGRGAWGVVISGTHRRLDRKVAIKQLPAAFAGSEAVRSRFAEEARLLATFDHPHIVPIFDYVEQEGLCLLVMEWLPGGSLWDRFSSTGVTPETSCAAVMAACAGLEYAHRRGVLHRDVKPENLIFNAAGILKVTDFGIARMIGGPGAPATNANEIMGTPAYMAPEQVTGGEVGAFTDVYSAGTMLYELLSGRLPFSEAGDGLALARRHVDEEPEPLKQVAPLVSSPLAEVTMRALAKDPSARYPSAEDFGSAVGEAAAATWGPGWLERSGLTILSSGRIMEAAVTGSGKAASSAGPVRRLGASPPGAAGDSLASPVAQSRQKVPRKAKMSAAGCLLLAAIAAFAFSARPLDVILDPGAIFVGPVDVASDSPVEIDPGNPVPVAVAPGLAGTLQARSVRLDLSVAGFTLAGSSAQLTPAGGSFLTEVDLSKAKFLAPSASTVQLELSGGGEPAVIRFRARSTQPPYLSIPALAAIVAVLFAFANIEAAGRRMRTGRSSLSDRVTVAAMGGLTGLVVQIVVWLVLSREPTLLSAISSALLGVAGGIAWSALRPPSPG